MLDILHFNIKDFDNVSSLTLVMNYEFWKCSHFNIGDELRILKM